MRKVSGVVILLAAYALLIPGLTQPMLSVVGTVEKEKLVGVGKDIIADSKNTPALMADLANVMLDNLDVKGAITAFDKTQSILGTANELYRSGHLPVAALIVLFSVIIPIFKGALALITITPISKIWRGRLNTLAGAISKWSMADVFVVAIFVSFLAANGLEGSNDLVVFNSTLGVGFWFFLGYCLLSILGSQILMWRAQIK